MTGPLTNTLGTIPSPSTGFYAVSSDKPKIATDRPKIAELIQKLYSLPAGGFGCDMKSLSSVELTQELMKRLARIIERTENVSPESMPADLHDLDLCIKSLDANDWLEIDTIIEKSGIARAHIPGYQQIENRMMASCIKEVDPTYVANPPHIGREIKWRMLWEGVEESSIGRECLCNIELKENIFSVLRLLPEKQRTVAMVQAIAEMFISNPNPKHAPKIIAEITVLPSEARDKVILKIRPYFRAVRNLIYWHTDAYENGRLDLTKYTPLPKNNYIVELIRGVLVDSGLEPGLVLKPFHAPDSSGVFDRVEAQSVINKSRLTALRVPVLPLDPALINPPVPLPVPPYESLKGSDLYCRDCIFYAYDAEGIRDEFWGCAWRNIQTCLSGYGVHVSMSDMMSLFGERTNIMGLFSHLYPGVEIDVGPVKKDTDSDEDRSKNFVPFERWMGDAEIFIGQLALHYYGFKSKIIFLHKQPALSPIPEGVTIDKIDFSMFRKILLQHFSKEGCIPLMIDNGISALNIIGVAEEGEDNTVLWIADPHINEGVIHDTKAEVIPGLYTITLDKTGKRIACSLSDRDASAHDKMYVCSTTAPEERGLDFDVSAPWGILFPEPKRA